MAGIDSNSVLVCRMDGTTTSFVDSSPSHKTVTANGNATQVTRKFNGTGGWFDGTDVGAITVPDSSDWDFGTGDFTVETFVCFATVGTFWIFSRNVNAEWSWYYDNGSNNLTLSIANVDVTTRSWTPVANTWYHLAVKRTSGDWTFWIDAVQQGAAYTNAASLSSAHPIYIWNTSGGIGGRGTGWLKEYRISSTARTITVPTLAYTSDSNTKLLLHFNNPSATSPLAPAIKFDGNGDYLSVGDSTDFDFGTGDFTIETFWRRAGTAGGSGHVFYDRSDGATDGLALWYESETTFDLYINAASVKTWSVTITANRWYHVALVKSSGVYTLYIDGVAQSTLSNSTNVNYTTAPWIGHNNGGTSYLNGYLREYRISNTARYTAAFTPSQTGFTVDANTKLYIKGNESNGVTTFSDSSTSSTKTVTTNGDTVINYVEDYRTTIFKDDGNTGHKPYAPTGSLAKVDFLAPFGSGSCALDGTGDYLSLADSADWDFGTGDFCLEGYFRWTATGGNYFMITRSTGAGGTNECTIYHSANAFTCYTTSTIINAVSFTPALNTWYHVVFSRSSGTGYLFINGSSSGSAASSDNITSASGIFIGGRATDSPFNGYLDNARISNVARYTATFNPPGQFNTGGLNQVLVL